MPEVQETLDIGEDSEGDGSALTSDNPLQSVCCRRKRRKARKSTYTVVNPDGNIYYYWLMLLSICVLYNLWTIILRQTFPELEEMWYEYWMLGDTFTDIIFLIDVIVQFRTGYLEQGLMVYDSCKLADHYIRSKAFILDIGSLIPLNVLQLSMGMKLILGLPKFLKVYRVYRYYYIVESRTVYPNVLRVGNLIHILLILAHWYGCFYYMLSEAEGFKGAWVYQNRPGENTSLSRKYLGSVYWSTLTLTTIGDLPSPETNVEYVFTITGYLTGVFILATIVGQVGNVITNRNTNRLEFERLLDNAKTYMHHHKVPDSMKRRVLRWYDYSWSRGRIQSGGDINSALRVLPDKLKTELALHVNLSVLKKVTIFQECQPEFLHDLVLKMKAYIFTPGDLICRKGEIAREMFIIADGILEVMRRTADVRSVGYSELFSLSREDVMAAMKDYPEAQEILQSLGRKRLKESQSINKAWRTSVQQSKEKRRNQNGDATEVVIESSPKSIVRKFKSDVIGLKNVLKRGANSTRSDSECVELNPLTNEEERPETSKSPLLRSAQGCDSSDEIAPASPKIGAGLPLLQRLKLLKEKQDLEKNEAALIVAEPEKEEVKKQEISHSVPLLQRFIYKKRNDCANLQTLSSTSEALNSSATNPNQTLSKRNYFTSSVEDNLVLASCKMNIPPVKDSKSLSHRCNQEKSLSENENWKMIKNAITLPGISYQDMENITTAKEERFQRQRTSFAGQSFSSNELNLASCDTNNKTLMKNNGEMTVMKKCYRSIDDLSPECESLSFVKKLKILNDRQKIAAELETAQIKSTSFDSADVTDAYTGHFFYNNFCYNNDKILIDITVNLSEMVIIKPLLTMKRRSDRVPMKHSQSATVFEMDRGNKQLRPAILRAITSTQDESSTQTITLHTDIDLSPESNETAERRHLKSILKKLSGRQGDLFASSGCAEVEKSSQAGIYLKKLLREPTAEGFAARHSKLAKSVTFNRMSLSEESSSCNIPVQNFVEAAAAEATLQEGVSLGLENNYYVTKNQGLCNQCFKKIQPWTCQPLEDCCKLEHSQRFQAKCQQNSAENTFLQPIFLQISNILIKHFSEMECHFLEQLRNLESDVRKRDTIISELQKKIDEMRFNVLRRKLWHEKARPEFGEEGIVILEKLAKSLRFFNILKQLAAMQGIFLLMSGQGGCTFKCQAETI
uniref:Cyclic nucleotide-binding domain-containing protein n=1 Tax=Rhodnius prolixus TaxID=13249 RepID=T1HBK2_RHOPR